MGTANFVPRIDLYGPDGALVTSAFTDNTGNRDAWMSLRLTNGGTFTVVVSSYFLNNSGTYTLNLAKVPGAFVVSAGDEGGTLTNGVLQPGTIQLGDLDMWTFAANAGDSIQLRMGTVGFVPNIDLYGPDGTLISSAFTDNTGYRDALMSLQLTNGGTFTAVVGSYYLGGSGTYTINLAKVPGAFVVSPGDAGGPLTNGVFQAGTNALGSLNMWSFAASAGDAIELRMGTVNFVPRIDLYGPDGALVTSAFTDNTGNRDAWMSLRLTNGGTFTVVVSSYFLNNGGTYTLNLAKVPGAFVVSAGDEGGTLTNGVLQPGTTQLGDLDMWTFAANAGDSIQLRMGTVGFVPNIDLYGPDGTLISSAFTANTGYRDALMSLQLTNGGTFTAVVGSYYLGGSGTYTINLAKVPGVFVVSPGGAGVNFTNGVFQAGTNALGSLNMWSFAASAGDAIELRMGTINFTPRIDLYGPDGALVTSAFTDNTGNRDAWMSLRLTNGGTFTVVVSSYFLNNSGTYTLNLAKVPGAFVVSAGDEGGTLTNGVLQPGTIQLGDLDMWTFAANAGDSIQLRMGTVGFVPNIDLYGPDGTLISSAFTANTGYRDALMSLQLTNGGTFTAVVGSYYLGGSGTYTINLAKVPGTFVVAPGGAGGTLTNGFMQPGTLALGGLDMWSFAGQAGDSIMLRMGTVNFTPIIDLYGPDGTLVNSAFTANTGYRDVLLALQLTNTGTFTAVVSSYYLNGSGTYNLNLAQAPGQVFVARGDEGGTMTNGFVYSGTNSLGDLDVWSFYGTPGDSNIFRIATVNYTPWLRLYGPSGALMAEAFTDNTGNRTNYLTYVVTNAGNYTFVSTAYFLNESGTYNLKQSRVPPDLVVPGTQVITDEDVTLNALLSAQDPTTRPNRSPSCCCPRLQAPR